MNANTLPKAAPDRVQAGWRDLLQGVEVQIEATGRECDRTGAFVSKNLDVLESLGFFALGVPADLGGGAVGAAEGGDKAVW